MVRGDDQLNGLQGGKRALDILCVATERTVSAFAYEEIGETSTEGDKRRERLRRLRRLINYSLSTTMNSSLSKRLKIDECKNQDPEQNPNRVASSPSSCHLESKRPQKVVSNKPVRNRKSVIVTDEDRTPTEWLIDVMREVNGMDAKLIFVKVLPNSDVDELQTRLMMPWKQILDMDFLNEEELEKIDRHHKKISASDKGADVIVVNSKGLQRKLKLKRWDMTSTSNYVLGLGWNKVVTDNILQRGTRLRIWSFHSPDMLFFAFVLSDPDPAPTECLNLLAKLCEETTCLEALQEANRMSSLVSDTELDLELRL
ncbi:unnamed protein product [Arabidopsis thaliana]|uniref:TF-B3 domain-containing protein n=1 Tax=Arabidopsis thaliana TaxID=3702 RepID=A0A654F8K8_ARATH|nr:unnamed protein product [Arabidopsis thaliana]